MCSFILSRNKANTSISARVKIHNSFLKDLSSEENLLLFNRWVIDLIFSIYFYSLCFDSQKLNDTNFNYF